VRDDKGVVNLLFCPVMSRSRHLRLGWLIAAVLQFLLPAFASVADARAEAESARTSRVHVEAPGTPGCPRIHPNDCVVCQLLATAATPSTGPSLLVPVERLIDATIARSVHPAYAVRLPGDPPQRAPPV
jgi:hypothetical protein